MPKKAKNASPEGEHIFPASQLTPLAIRWKQLTAARRHKEAMVVLEEIVVLSTAMFERLAQYYDFHYTVDLSILVSAAQEKVVRWLLKWQPKKGKLFSWFSKSYAGDTHVILADGSSKRIDEIVDNRLKLDVLSWNRSTGLFEAKPIINWIKTPVAYMDSWRRLRFKVPREANAKLEAKRDHVWKKITLTNDHEVYTDRGIVRVGELEEKDTLYVARPSVTPDGMSALIGMYLGYGTIDTRGYFVVAHGTDQEAYTQHVADQFGKREVWKGNVTLKWIQKATGVPLERTYTTYRTRILLKRIWKNCPLTKVKTISEWLLDNINPIVMAYWYMDDGFLSSVKKKGENGVHRYFPSFCSESFTYEDCERIAERLYVEWGLKTWLRRESVRDGVVYGRISVCDNSVERFFHYVAPYMLDCFVYKIPPRYREMAKKPIQSIRYNAMPCTQFSVREVAIERCGPKTLEALAYKYDITVADNHNVVVMPEGKTQNGYTSGLCACQCAKNSFRSELVKVNQYRKRFHVTSDNLEKFYGVDDHEVDKRSLAAEFRRSLKDLTCRWGDPQEIGAIKFLVECIVADDGHDKRAAIRSAAYAYCISPDLAKFFYDWTLTALRHLFYNKVYVALTWHELVAAAHTYTFLADLQDHMTPENFRKFIITHQGARLKIPTVAQLQRLQDSYKMYREADKTDLDPDSVAEVAKKHKKTARAASEIFEEMVDILDPKRSGEYGVYDDDDNMGGGQRA